MPSSVGRLGNYALVSRDPEGEVDTVEGQLVQAKLEQRRALEAARQLRKPMHD